MLRDHRSIECYLSSSKRIGPKNSCRTGLKLVAVHYQLRYQANWQLAVIWCHDKPFDCRYSICV